MEWDNLYKKKTFRHKNLWPDNLIIQSISSNFTETIKKPKIKVLELGFGWGNNLRYFKEKKFNYYGIEQSKTAFLHCKKNGYKNIYNGNFIDLTMFKDNYFDCIVDRQSLQHNNFKKIQEIVDNLYFKLKPKGLFFSHLISKANYNVKTTYFDKKKILKVFKKFNIKKIEKHIRKNVKNYELSNTHEFYNLELEKL